MHLYVGGVSQIVIQNHQSTIICCFFHRSIADQLKMNQKVDAEFFENVTIYFSDICGFTTISSCLNPHQIIELLNSLYR